MDVLGDLTWPGSRAESLPITLEAVPSVQRVSVGVVQAVI